MKQSQPLRIENPDFASFTTIKTVQARLWFVNNPAFEERVLGYLAKYQEKYEVTLYSFVFQGNHDHSVSQFPNCNRAQFFRDLNARTAEAARALIPRFRGGHLFARRYSEQALVRPEDIEERFFYAALQPVRAGLCERIGDYPGYNSFWDAINGVERKFKVVDWSGFNQAKRMGLKPNVKEFTTHYPLKFSRIPGYEHLSQKEYSTLMLEKLEARRLKLVKEMKDSGHIFPTKKNLCRTKPGSLPRTTKSSKRTDRRPLILTSCLETKRWFLQWYFNIYNAYKLAVAKYLAGDPSVSFPPNTYRPPSMVGPPNS